MRLMIGITCALFLAVSPSFGITVEDFDGGGNSTFTGNSNNGGALPAVIGGGPTGSFLRLMPDGVGGLNNSVGFDQTDNGHVTSVQFDVRMPLESTHTGCCNQRADGFNVAFLNTGQHGATGAAPIASNFGERPTLTHMSAIGFDIFEGGNNNVYSLNMNGREIATSTINASALDLNNNEFNNVNIQMTQTNSGTAITMDITTSGNGTVNVFNNALVEGWSAGGRLAFGGRTGGAFTSVDLDNIAVNYAGLDVSTTADFDSVGTGFSSRQLGSNPGAAVVSGGPAGNFLRLINDGINSQQNTISFDATEEGLDPGKSLVADFNFRGISANGPAADGFSMLLLPTDTYGTVGQGQEVNGGQAEEPNFAGVVAVGFDFHPAGSVNDASLHFGNEIINITLNPNAQIDLDSGDFHNARLELNESLGQVLASLVLTEDIYGAGTNEVTVFSNVVIPGLAELYAYRVQFAGRTGGLNLTIDLDDISVTSPIIPEPATASLALMGLAGLVMRRKRNA